MGQVNTPTDTLARLKALEDELNVIRKQVGLNSATISGGKLTVQKGGAIQMLSPAGHRLFYVGPGGANHPDGSIQQITEIFDDAGVARFAVWDPSSPAASGQQMFMYDSSGHFVFTTDINGGQAVPWYNVPLYPYFRSTDTTTPVDPAGAWNSYANIATSAQNMAPGNVMWEGRIAYVSHPRIAIDGAWGGFGGTTSVTYELDVAGTSVGTWTIGAGTTVSTEGPWDISGFLGQTAVAVQLKVASWIGAGRITVQPLGCYLRQT